VPQPQSFYPTGNEMLDEALQQLEADMQNQGLWLAVARMGMQTGHIDLAIHHYKHLIKINDDLTDQIIGDISDMIRETEETENGSDGTLLSRLHRLLGDCYHKQKRFREAMAEYSWTFKS
jgi:tetratricopeptide (TPR) repeat protein